MGRKECLLIRMGILLHLQGQGTCPFGNKCFYLHALENGQVVDVGVPQQRRRLNSQGEFNLVEVRSTHCARCQFSNRPPPHNDAYFSPNSFSIECRISFCGISSRLAIIPMTATPSTRRTSPRTPATRTKRLGQCTQLQAPSKPT